MNCALRCQRCGYSLLALVVVSCGGTAELNTDRRGGGNGGTTNQLEDAGTGAPAPTETAPEPKRMPPQVNPPTRKDSEPAGKAFLDPGCPEVLEPVEDRACDPLAETSTCPAGMGCSPFVDYPEDPCSPERFGTRCRFHGVGTQGEPCTESACASGFLCVATGQGTQCARLCELPGRGDCPNGLVCGSVDIKGFGVCF